MQAMNKPDISVIVPVYNSEAMLEELFDRIHKVFIVLGKTFEVVFVDDGSRDKSWQKLEGLKQQYPRQVTAIRFTKNFGQHNAMLCAFSFVKADLIVTMDDDLQHPPEEIPKLIACQQETQCDVVYGIPMSKQHNTLRNTGSSFLTITSEYREVQGSSFRLIRREFTDKIKTTHQFNYLFLDAILNWYTANMRNVAVEHHPRRKGRSGYNAFKLFKVYMRLLINYSNLPSKIIVYGGIAMSVGSFLLGLHFLWKKLVHNVPLGYTSIIVSILFSTSILILGMGLLGLYIHKIFQLHHHKPVYFIKNILGEAHDS